MSRIGNKPIPVPSGVKVEVADRTVKVTGAKGTLSVQLPAGLAVQVKGGECLVQRPEGGGGSAANHGTYRSLVNNMVLGVSQGYLKTLEISGVGFKGQVQGRKLVMALGYSHPIEFDVPEGIEIKMLDNTTLTVAGPDKRLVGDVSARIRGYYPAEPYKGKGVCYRGERIRRKAGKTVA